MRPTKFKLESLGYEVFDGYTKGDDWNGWDCPYFTFQQAQTILQTYNELQKIIQSTNLAFYDTAADAFVFPSYDEAETEIFSSITENGQKLYPIGSFSWIWEEIV